jgi:class 3 adenylate cyclase
MALKDDLKNRVDSILSQTWNTRDGQVIPDSTDIALAGGAVKLDTTILYSDLADSTELAAKFDKRIAAKVYKTFLTCTTKIIRAEGGHIRSFDGDRVMGIFIGDNKNSSAAKCALKIKWAFDEIIRPKLLAKYEILRNGSFTLTYCSGIDTSSILAVRAGIRDSNDIVWVGRAPNIAAKLSGFRETSTHNTYITKDVYDRLSKDTKYSDGKNMWENRTWRQPIDGVTELYRSSWRWPL